MLSTSNWITVIFGGIATIGVLYTILGYYKKNKKSDDEQNLSNFQSPTIKTQGETHLTLENNKSKVIADNGSVAVGDNAKNITIQITKH